jgi:hypothetical protein
MYKTTQENSFQLYFNTEIMTKFGSEFDRGVKSAMVAFGEVNTMN